MAAFRLKAQVMSEDLGQMALVKWCRLMKIPVIHIANEGKRSFAMASWLKSMGMRAGVADLFIARPRLPYAGYWIEMKRAGNKPTALQTLFLEDMRLEGYRADWFDDWMQAKESIEKYLDMKL
jgi:hypothetical protein